MCVRPSRQEAECFVVVCEDKKELFKKLVELAKSPEQAMDFATLKPEIAAVVRADVLIIKLQGVQMNNHSHKHKHTDLFDYYLVQDTLHFWYEIWVFLASMGK
ncbi:hypothetical protein ACFOPX_01315 [Helicobacter baculiformis]|uniref:Uncharacterized protein n=1 Tax=Helicobacter baculiformis TaxID=427351 RepID=A0ABV7ZG93_9HELI